MTDRPDNLNFEIDAALELAAELRLENDPTALEDAIELEIACSFWGKVLPEAISFMRKVEQLVAFPISALLASRLPGRAIKQLKACSVHIATVAQIGPSQALSDLATKAMTSVTAVAVAVVPVAIVSHTPSNSSAVHSLVVKAEARRSNAAPTVRDLLRDRGNVLCGSTGARNQAPASTRGVKHTFRGSVLCVREDVEMSVPTVGVQAPPMSAVNPALISAEDFASGVGATGIQNQDSPAPPSISTSQNTSSFPPPLTSSSGFTPGPIVQSTQNANSTTTTSASFAFTDQLSVSGNVGPVNFEQSNAAQISSGTRLTVSTAGLVMTTGYLAAGTYSISGIDSDSPGDQGTWSYSLKVTPVQIGQGVPKSNTTTTSSSSSFTDELNVSGNTGPVSYVQTSGAAALNVTSSGVVTTIGYLTAGTYKAAGTVSDGLGDTGSWNYSLKVTPVPIVQDPRNSNSTTTSASGAYVDRLITSGNTGPVTFTQSSTSQSTSGAHVNVSPTGQVTVTGELASGIYNVAGSDSDSLGDTGKWTYSLDVAPVPIIQIAPSSNSTTTAGSSGFGDALSVSGNSGTVAYVQTSGAPALEISPSGTVATSGNLAAGIYNATGTESDAFGDSGSWSYILTVNPVSISQAGSNSNSVTIAQSSAFAGQLAVGDKFGTVTYQQISGDQLACAAHLVVSASGEVTASGELAAGTYQANGTDSDGLGDAGLWSYTLVVTATRLSQVAPEQNSTTVTQASTFADQLAVTGNTGAITFVQTSGAMNLRISPTGAVAATGALAAGTYDAVGTDSDALGDTGTWSYTLTVAATSVTATSGSPPTADSAPMTQDSPTSSETTTAQSAAFTNQLSVSGNSGAVTYAQTSGEPSLIVSTAGVVTTKGDLTPGTYKAAGTDSDSLGTTGTWNFLLFVAPVPIMQTTSVLNSTNTGPSSAFVDELSVGGNTGAVVYVQTTNAQCIVPMSVSPSGVVKTTGDLPAGTYRITGSDSDTSGDSGTWSYTLLVAARQITQAGTNSNTTTTTASSAFVDQLAVIDSSGVVDYQQTSGALDLTISSSGQVTTAGGLAAGTYKATGTESDSLGDVGTWAYTLVVTAAPSPGPAISTIGSLTP